MTRFFNLTAVRHVISAAVLCGAMALATGTASASDCHVPRCHWKTVTVIETIQEPCVHYVTKYDHCGKPFTVKVVTYKTVQVPVQKRIKVCY